jgi:hypothetical protein
VAEPFLDLGDVGLVVERIGGGRRPQRMGADLEPQFRRIPFYQLETSKNLVVLAGL